MHLAAMAISADCPIVHPSFARLVPEHSVKVNLEVHVH